MVSATSAAEGEGEVARWREERAAADAAWVVTVPPGVSGNVRIERVEVTHEQARMVNLRAMFKGHRTNAEAGTYTHLYVGRELMMSDTPDERSAHRGFVNRARGEVLVGGLGIGMVLNALLAKPEVKHVTVVEANEHVMKLVAPHYAENPRVTLVHADVFTWTPPSGMVYDAIWHDIWPNICADNLKDMTRLRRRYKKWTRSGRVGDVECWERAQCQYQARRG